MNNLDERIAQLDALRNERRRRAEPIDADLEREVRRLRIERAETELTEIASGQFDIYAAMSEATDRATALRTQLRAAEQEEAAARGRYGSRVARRRALELAIDDWTRELAMLEERGKREAMGAMA